MQIEWVSARNLSIVSFLKTHDIILAWRHYLQRIKNNPCTTGRVDNIFLLLCKTDYGVYNPLLQLIYLYLILLQNDLKQL